MAPTTETRGFPAGASSIEIGDLQRMTVDQYIAVAEIFPAAEDGTGGHSA